MTPSSQISWLDKLIKTYLETGNSFLPPYGPSLLISTKKVGLEKCNFFSSVNFEMQEIMHEKAINLNWCMKRNCFCKKMSFFSWRDVSSRIARRQSFLATNSDTKIELFSASIKTYFKSMLMFFVVLTLKKTWYHNATFSQNIWSWKHILVLFIVFAQALSLWPVVVSQSVSRFCVRTSAKRHYCCCNVLATTYAFKQL